MKKFNKILMSLCAVLLLTTGCSSNALKTAYTKMSVGTGEDQISGYTMNLRLFGLYNGEKINCYVLPSGGVGNSTNCGTTRIEGYMWGTASRTFYYDSDIYGGSETCYDFSISSTYPIKYHIEQERIIYKCKAEPCVGSNVVGEIVYAIDTFNTIDLSDDTGNVPAGASASDIWAAHRASQGASRKILKPSPLELDGYVSAGYRNKVISMTGEGYFVESDFYTSEGACINRSNCPPDAQAK